MPCAGGTQRSAVLHYPIPGRCITAKGRHAIRGQRANSSGHFPGEHPGRGSNFLPSTDPLHSGGFRYSHRCPYYRCRSWATTPHSDLPEPRLTDSLTSSARAAATKGLSFSRLLLLTSYVLSPAKT